jgi:hypothetical protein
MQAEYPFKPPGIMILTPNGRFDTGKRLCLSMSDYHPEVRRPTPPVYAAAGLMNRISKTLSPIRPGVRGVCRAGTLCGPCPPCSQACCRSCWSPRQPKVGSLTLVGPSQSQAPKTTSATTKQGDHTAHDQPG